MKVLRALADYLDLSLGDLLEGIVLHAFDGKSPFSAERRRQIGELKKFYGLDLDSSASHRLVGGGCGARGSESARTGMKCDLMSDEEFLREFENCSLPGDAFHHTEHVRVAFLYLGRYGVLQAIERMSGL